MRALLVLFMVDAPVNGGLGLRVENAAAIYGLFTAGVYLAALPGGWCGDRLFGAHRAVWLGGILIALGYLALAVPDQVGFYPALCLVVLGTGMLKPNVTAMVGGLYENQPCKRDAGFTIFYMGINIGAAIGPVVCSTVAKFYGWRAGFGAAGFGMLAGLLQYGLTSRFLGTVGRRASKHEPGLAPSSCATRLAGSSDGFARSKVSRAKRAAVVVFGLFVAGVIYALVGPGSIQIDAVTAARSAAAIISCIGVAYFVYALLVMQLTASERRRVLAILILFLASAVFWAGFEQAGSSFNLFAQNHTQRVLHLPDIGARMPGTFEVPAGWFQSLGAVFVSLLAPAVAAIWTALERRGIALDPSVKFGFGLIMLGAGFGVMTVASWYAIKGTLVSPFWLVATYFLHSLGELCVSPVGLSSVTRLAPSRLVGQMVGLWFLATSLGNVVAGLIAGQLRSDTVTRIPFGYLVVGLAAFGVGLVLLAIAKPMSRLSSKPED